MIKARKGTLTKYNIIMAIESRLLVQENKNIVMGDRKTREKQRMDEKNKGNKGNKGKKEMKEKESETGILRKLKNTERQAEYQKRRKRRKNIIVRGLEKEGRKLKEALTEFIREKLKVRREIYWVLGKVDKS